MASILVSVFRAQTRPEILQIDSVHLAATRAQRRRLPSGVRPDAGTRPDFRLFRLLCALLFRLFAIVLAPALFLPPAQGLAL
jgi:hypothetical protein